MPPSEKEMQTHRHWMSLALDQARLAGEAGEVPVGAVLVSGGRLLGSGYNHPVSSHDPTAHAEIAALRKAAATAHNYRLPGATLYVTIEPCTMCLGALIHARIETLVFGAREPRAGAVVSQLQLPEKAFFNHRLHYIDGILADSCAALMQDFFARRRGSAHSKSGQ